MYMYIYKIKQLQLLCNKHLLDAHVLSDPFLRELRLVLCKHARLYTKHIIYCKLSALEV